MFSKGIIFLLGLILLHPVVAVCASKQEKALCARYLLHLGGPKTKVERYFENVLEAALPEPKVYASHFDARIIPPYTHIKSLIYEKSKTIQPARSLTEEEVKIARRYYPQFDANFQTSLLHLHKLYTVPFAIGEIGGVEAELGEVGRRVTVVLVPLEDSSPLPTEQYKQNTKIANLIAMQMYNEASVMTVGPTYLGIVERQGRTWVVLELSKTKEVNGESLGGDYFGIEVFFNLVGRMDWNAFRQSNTLDNIDKFMPYVLQLKFLKTQGGNYELLLGQGTGNLLPNWSDVFAGSKYLLIPTAPVKTSILPPESVSGRITITRYVLLRRMRKDDQLKYLDFLKVEKPTAWANLLRFVEYMLPKEKPKLDTSENLKSYLQKNNRI